MAKHKWKFKAHFRREAYGWKGTALASKRLKEAVSEIKKVARADSSLAGEGVVELFSRLYPAVEHIDTSSGALGTALNRTIEELLPILLQADWDMDTRGKWLWELEEAVREEGWGIFDDLMECWGELCVYPGLANLKADELIPHVKDTFLEGGTYLRQTAICLSCLLFTQRYKELQELIQLDSRQSWFNCKFWAQALEKQGQLKEALVCAEHIRSQQRIDIENHEIDQFCEAVLIKMGEIQEAYEKYGLNVPFYGTYLNIYRAICKKYPTIDKRKILLDCIKKSGQKGKWFASAKNEGFLDIALECAETGDADPNTLLRATKDFRNKNPMFAVKVGIEAIMKLLTGQFNEPITPLDIDTAYCYPATVAKLSNLMSEFTAELSKRVFKNSGRIRPALKKVIMDKLQG